MFLWTSFPCWLGSSCFTGSLFLHPFPADWAHPVSLVRCFSILSLLTGLILFHWFFVSPSFPCWLGSSCFTSSLFLHPFPVGWAHPVSLVLCLSILSLLTGLILFHWFFVSPSFPCWLGSSCFTGSLFLHPFPAGWAHPVSLVLCFSILSLLAGLILFHWFFVSPSFPCWLGSSCFTGSLFLHPFPVGWAHPVSLVLCFSILSLLTGLILFHWFFVSPSFPCWLGSSCFTGSLFLHPFPVGWAHPVSLVRCFSILSLLTGLILFHWFFVSLDILSLLAGLILFHWFFVSPSFPC